MRRAYALPSALAWNAAKLCEELSLALMLPRHQRQNLVGRWVADDPMSRKRGVDQHRSRHDHPGLAMTGDSALHKDGGSIVDHDVELKTGRGVSLYCTSICLGLVIYWRRAERTKMTTQEKASRIKRK